jgi:hypothetical protein
MTSPASIHASAVLIGARALLIRGPSGSGKSRLALTLLQAGHTRQLPFTRLVGDDRVQAQAHHGRLVVGPAPPLAGLLEVRGIGIRRVSYEPLAVAKWVVDLAAPDAGRLPAETAVLTVIEGVELARLPVAPGVDPLPMLMEMLRPEPLAGSGSAPYKAA